MANEVEDLAQEASRASEDISQRVQRSQGDTEAAVRSTTQITEVVRTMDDHQTTIAGAVDEQTATTRELTRSVADVEEARSAAQRLDGLSDELPRLIGAVEVRGGAGSPAGRGDGAHLRGWIPVAPSIRSRSRSAVAVVPGVLLDQVKQHPAQRVLRAVAAVGAGELQRGAAAAKSEAIVTSARQTANASSWRRSLDVVGARVVGAPQGGRVLAVEHPAEPGALDLGQVPHQPEQRHPGRRHRGPAQLLAGEPWAGGRERVAVQAEAGAKPLALPRTGPRHLGARVGHRAASMTRHRSRL